MPVDSSRAHAVITSPYHYDEKLDKGTEDLPVPYAVFIFKLFLHCSYQHLKGSAVFFLDRNAGQAYKIIGKFRADFQHKTFLVMPCIE